MERDEFVKELKKLIDDQNISSSRKEELRNYLNALLDSSISTPLAQQELAKYEAELQGWIEYNKACNNNTLENFRAVILMGQNALKSAFLMNGGATVALLAFLGKLSDHQSGMIPKFASSLMIFVAGVFFTVLASGGTYLSQYKYADEKEKSGNILRLIVIILNMISYGCFIGGSCVAYRAFMNFSTIVSQ